MTSSSPLLLPGQPTTEGGPVFGEPWEAHVFAMAVRLHEQGLFTWTKWAATLAALERLVAAQGAASSDEQERTREAWRRAADRTPHGQPIELRREDYTS